MLIYYLTGCIRLKSFRSRSAPRAMHSVLWDGQSAMAGSRCFVLSCSAPSEKQRCTLTGSFRFLTSTDSFLDISSVPPTYCPSPWCGRFTLKQTRGHSRYGRTKPGGTVEARLACTDFLQEIDLLFEADSPWVWAAEKHFAKLKEENPNLALAASRGNSVVDPELGSKKAEQADAQSEERQEVAKH
jgi:hypothetical protein